MKVKADIFCITILVLHGMVSMIIILQDMFDAIYIMIFAFLPTYHESEVKTSSDNLC